MGKKVFCPKHSDTVLACPKCTASRGGKVTAKKYSPAQMREWGKRGGRPRKLTIADGGPLTSTPIENGEPEC
jgi:hypothetical protein